MTKCNTSNRRIPRREREKRKTRSTTALLAAFLSLTPRSPKVLAPFAYLASSASIVFACVAVLFSAGALSTCLPHLEGELAFLPQSRACSSPTSFSFVSRDPSRTLFPLPPIYWQLARESLDYNRNTDRAEVQTCKDVGPGSLLELLYGERTEKEDLRYHNGSETGEVPFVCFAFMGLRPNGRRSISLCSDAYFLLCHRSLSMVVGSTFRCDLQRRSSGSGHPTLALAMLLH